MSVTTAHRLIVHKLGGESALYRHFRSSSFVYDWFVRYNYSKPIEDIRMTTLNLSEVSKQFKVNRSTIYRAVSSGRLSRRADGTFDLTEVVRCFGEPKVIKAKPLEPQLEPSNQEFERLRKEFADYKRQAQEREDWLKNQIDRMQTLLELKSQPVPDAMSQQQSKVTHSNSGDATLETIDNTEPASSETLHAVLQQHPVETQRNTAHAIVQQPEKKRGLFGRLVKAVLD